MHFLSYGEDALTLWALTHRTSAFLERLGDHSDPAGILVIFRPSFGRRGGGSRSDPGRRPSSQFGEFDAIVGTPSGVYLVESKWSRSGEIEGEVLTLRPEQRWRHRLMRWYIEAWRRLRPESWTEFVQAAQDEFRARFEGMGLPPSGSALATNLEFVLRRLAAFDAPVHDVLLFACAPGAVPPRRVEPDGFRLVCIDYPVAGGTGFVELQPAGTPVKVPPPSPTT